MSRTHLIKHYGRYVHRHEDYIAICENDDCAAQLLDLFEYWTGCRHSEINRIRSYNHVASKAGQPEQRVPDLWLYESIDDFRNGLFQGYGKTYVIKALKLLKEKGFIKDRESKLKFDRTREYLFIVATVQEALDQWHSAQASELDYVESSFLNYADNTGNVESLNLNHESSEVNHDGSKVVMDSSEVNSIYISNSPSNSPSNLPSNLQASEGKKEELARNGNGNGSRPPAPNINSLASQEAIGDIKQSTVICEDKSSGAAVATINYAALGMQDPNDRKTRQMREFNWVPDGPWKVDNKLDNNFVDWLTAKWVRDFGRDVHSTRANVQRHLKKDAANFAIAWDEYHREHLHRFSNAAVRERSGGVLSPEEQQKLLQHSAAVTQAVPEELASVAYTLPSAVEEFTPDIAAKLNGSAPALPQGAENPDCYQIYKPAESVADISPEEAAANIKKLREMMQSMGGKRAMPKIEPSKPKSVVEDLMADLEDPGIRFSVDVQARAQRLVGTDDGWCADYNEQGNIVAIYRF